MPTKDAIDVPALQARAADLKSRYEAFQREGLALDMTRGKPCSAQLDLSSGLLAALGEQDYRAADGTDCRNYGGLDGLPETKALFAEFLGVSPSEILVGDNSSLALMHDTVARALSHGVPGGTEPWSRAPVRVLCPSPGYDRHFAICEHFGVGMLVVDLLDDGPDMDQVEALTRDDPSIKGLWLVPKFSNPTGICVSEAVTRRLARLPTAASDFRVFWDNAYAHHDLVDEPLQVPNLLEQCKAAGRPDRVLIYASTAKISFAGAGVAVMAGSAANMAWMRHHRSFQTIGPDKLNQLRHVHFFRNMAGLRAHMQRHAAILRPKFEAVQRVLREELGGSGLAQWTDPKGGYFVSLDTLDGCAKAVVSMAAHAGVKLTQAGATFPYGKDPRDRNIRIAPSLPSLGEIEQAMRVLAVCIQRVSLAKLEQA